MVACMVTCMVMSTYSKVIRIKLYVNVKRFSSYACIMQGMPEPYLLRPYIVSINIIFVSAKS